MKWISLIIVLLFVVACDPATYDDYSRPGKVGSQPLDVVIGSPSEPIEEPDTTFQLLISPPAEDGAYERFTVTVENAPPGTETVWFSLAPAGLAEAFGLQPNLGIDNDGSDGYSIVVRKEEHKEGTYDLVALAFDNEDDSLDTVQRGISITAFDATLRDFLE